MRKLYTVCMYDEPVDKWYSRLEAKGVSLQFAKGFLSAYSAMRGKGMPMGIFEYNTEDRYSGKPKIFLEKRSGCKLNLN